MAQNTVSLHLLLCFFVSFFSNAAAQIVPAVYVFGDSLVDVGNNNYLTLSIVKANYPHNGIDYPGKKATGRFSNGKNAADFIAEKVGLPTSPPYLSIAKASNKTNAFSAGVSFASGGAGILDGTDQQYKQSIPLSKQIEYYTTVYTELVQEIGPVAAQKHFSKSLYGFVIGSNDLLGYFGTNSDARLKSTPQQLITSMTTNLSGYLKRLYNLGARKFVMVGVGAIGCCPSQRHQNKTTGVCKEDTNYWSQRYNEGVKSLLQNMKTELKDINYSLFDTYTVLLTLIQNPAEYGFSEVKSACCGLGTFNAGFACLPISKYCSNRRDHVFWDAFHPTEAASEIIVNNIFDGPQKYVYPVNVRQLIAL